ncbi:MAG: hypothetical protein AAF911_10975, partial [Planctomycetota bacterium]
IKPSLDHPSFPAAKRMLSIYVKEFYEIYRHESALNAVECEARWPTVKFNYRPFFAIIFKIEA